MTWLAPAGLAVLILLASVQCWPAGNERWSSRLREQALLAGAWLGALCMGPICWPLALLLALALWRDRNTAGAAVRTWGLACLVWLLVTHVPPPARWVLPAAYVTAALGQCVLMGYQAAKWAPKRLTYYELGNALHGSMGTRFFAGMLIAQAMPVAPWWALPVLILGLGLSSSATALLVALAGMLVTYPAWALPLVGGAALVGMPILALRQGWRSVLRPRAFGDGIRERILLWRLMGARWTRCSWRVRLLGGGHDAFSTQGRWWARVDGPMNRVHLHGCHDGLQALLEVGLLGVAALLALVGLTLRHGGLGDPLTGTLVAILVGSLMQFPLHTAHMAVPALILFALRAAA